MGNSDIIFLMLGPTCNFSCKYCFQNDYSNNCKHESIKDVKICDKVVQYFKKHPTTHKKIVFWGGEPLLYWDEIVKFVEKFEDSPINFGFVTNGFFLTQDKVDFINEHKITCSLSHDGPNTKITRGCDVLDMGIGQYFKQIKNKGIQTVFSKYTQNLNSLDNYFKEYNCNIKVMPLRCSWEGMSKDLYDFDLEFLRLQIHEALKFPLNKYTNKNKPFTRGLIMAGLSRYLESIKNPNKKYNCCTFDSMQHVDKDGNVMFCHNTNEYFLGKINDNYDFELNYTNEEIENLKDKLYLENHPKCQNCSVKEICKLECFLGNDKITGVDKCCDFLRLLYTEINHAFVTERIRII